MVKFDSMCTVYCTQGHYVESGHSLGRGAPFIPMKSRSLMFEAKKKKKKEEEEHSRYENALIIRVVHSFRVCALQTSANRAGLLEWR